MDPYKQQPQQNQYDFITNPTQPSKRPALGGSMKSRVIVVVGGIFLLIILASIVNMILSSAGNTAKQNLRNVVAEQEEIIRVSGLGSKDALESQTRGYASTVGFVVGSDRKAMDETLKSEGVKMDKLMLSAKLNPKTVETLTAAGSNNRYDETMTDTLNKLLQTHRQTIKTAYDSASKDKTKSTLEQLFKNTENLLAPNKTDSQ